MRLDVVRVGNSRGVRLPKPILEQCRIKDEVEVTIKGEVIQLKAIAAKKKKPRQGWVEACRAMHEARDDKLLIPEHVDAEMEDWEW